MKKQLLLISIIIGALLFSGGCLEQKESKFNKISKINKMKAAPIVPKTTAPKQPMAPTPIDYAKLKADLVRKYRGKIPKEWGERVTGVKTRLVTKEKVIALTFDACGGNSLSNGYDGQLIEFLKKERIPATLFISGKWQKANPALLKTLAQEPLFDIQDHGLLHRPCSVNGKSAYGIKGTTSIAEVVDEIEQQGRELNRATGKRPRFYRSGTNYYDEVAVAIAGDLGYKVISYQVLGDAGATYKKEQVKKALLGAKPGDIVIMHMNHPEGDTAEGVIEAIPLLRKQGYRFVKLADYSLR